jgi:hypothetical protein
MITDSCRCGAEVSIQHQYYSDEQVTHYRWLQAHEGCRSYSDAKLDAIAGNQQREAILTGGASGASQDKGGNVQADCSQS